MKKISLQYRITLQDFTEAYEYHWKSKKLGTRTNFYLSIFGIVAAILLSFYNMPAGIVVFVVGFFLLSITLLRSFLYKRSYLASPKYAKEIHATFSDSEIHTQCAIGSSGLTWDIYIAHTESKNKFLLYVSKNNFSILPKRAFKNNQELEFFRELIHNKIK